MNLAHISCDSGQFDKARAYVARVLQFNPDSPSAKNFAKALTAVPTQLQIPLIQSQI